MLKLHSTTDLKTETITADHIRLLCAWCHIEMRAPRIRTAQPAPESHGICVQCAVKLGMPADYFDQRQVA